MVQHSSHLVLQRPRKPPVVAVVVSLPESEPEIFHDASGFFVNDGFLVILTALKEEKDAHIPIAYFAPGGWVYAIERVLH